MNAIDAEQLSFSYGARPVVRDVSLTLRPGELVGLVGPNGAGKTTLLHLLLGLLERRRGASGRVRLLGDDLGGLSRAAVARRITLVPQESPADFAFTVREVVAMGRTPYLGRFRPESGEDLAAIDRALAATETSQLEDRPVSELSGGERQRVHIARALAQETPVLLLDEPTANLDVEHQLTVLGLLRRAAAEGKAVLSALHDLSLAARFCDRLLLVAGGRLVASGPPAVVLTEENLSLHFRIRARLEYDGGGGLLAVVPVSPVGD